MPVIRLQTRKEYQIQHVKIKHERKQCLLPTPAYSKEELTSMLVYFLANRVFSELFLMKS